MATGPVPGAVYPAQTTQMQTLPDKFVPPANLGWGIYPQFSQNGQTSRINTRNPQPGWEYGPGYTAAGGQSVSLVNANPVIPLPPQPPNTPLV